MSRSARAQLQRRGDVVEHRHRRVVDELLVDHRHVALAHRHAGDVVRRRPAPGPRVGWSSPAIRRISAGLAGLRGAQQHRHRARLQRQVESEPDDSAPTRLRDASQRQLHARSPAVDGARRSAGDAVRRRAAATARPARAAAASTCRPSLVRRHSTSSALRAHSCALQVVELGLVQAGRHLGAQVRRGGGAVQHRRCGCRRRAPAAAPARRRQPGVACRQRLRRSVRSRCRAAAAGRSRPPGRRPAAGAPAVQAGRRSPQQRGEQRRRPPRPACGRS